MKKVSKVLLTLALILVMGICGVSISGCSNNKGPKGQDPAPDNQSQAATSSKRYVATPVAVTDDDGKIQNYRHDYSFKFMDEESLKLYDTYYTYLGKVDWVPIASNTPKYYNGVTPFELTYSTTQTTQGSITESISTAMSSSTQTVHSETDSVNVEISAKVTWVKDIFDTTVKVGYGHTWADSTATTEQTSRTDTYTTFQGWSVSNTETIRIPVGNNNEPIGYYRFSLFATCDVYVAMVHDIGNDEWAYEYSFFARPNTLFESIDYSATNEFGAKTSAAGLTFDTAIISTLSVIPSRSCFVKFVSNGVTIKTEAVNYGSFATPPTNPTSATQNFIGWSPNVSAMPITSDRTFTAQWVDKVWNTCYDGTGIAVCYGLNSIPIPLDIANITGKSIPSYSNSVRITLNKTYPVILMSAGTIEIFPALAYFNYTFVNGIFIVSNVPGPFSMSGLTVIKIEYLE